MDLDKIKALAAELSKNVKTKKDLNAITHQWLKMTVKTIDSRIYLAHFCKKIQCVLSANKA